MDNRRTVFPVAVLLAVTACSEADLTAPRPPGSVTAAIPFEVSMSVVTEPSLDFDADLNNIVDVILPGLVDVKAAETLKTHVANLQEHLAAGDRVAAAEVIDLVRSALAPDIGNATDLGYVAMVLYNIETALAQ